nr:LEF-3 [Calliteara abietis nucleopolyhedrovirus]
MAFVGAYIDGENNNNNNNINDDDVDVKMSESENFNTRKEAIKKTTKRKLNFDDCESNENDDSLVVKTKQVKLDDNENGAQDNFKRISTSSEGSCTSNGSGIIKRNFKTFTGELLTKTLMSINNEIFYLFKFLFDNVTKEYYGNANQYHNMRVNSVYEIKLNYENNKIYVGEFKLNNAKDKSVRVQQQLRLDNFESGDTVSVYAQLKCGFKMIDSNCYKMVLHLFYNDALSAEISTLKEIECSANLKKFSEAIKDCEIMNENDLLSYFHANQDKIVVLQKIKCNQINNNLKNLNLQTFTQILLEKDPSKCAKFHNDGDATTDETNELEIQNISRSNKQILKGEISTLTANIANEERLSISYQLKTGPGKIIKASFFKNNYNNNTSNASSTGNVNKNFSYLEVNMNQLNELIENELALAYIYVTYDYKNYNLIGLTKYEIDSELYASL